MIPREPILKYQFKDGELSGKIHIYIFPKHSCWVKGKIWFNLHNTIKD